MQPNTQVSQHVDDPARHHSVQTVEIVVNRKKVTVPKKVTGAQIKAAAGVPADFELFRVRGHKEEPVGHDEQITVTKGEKFVASPTLDPSYVGHPTHVSAAEAVRDAFPRHAVDVAHEEDGRTLITLRRLVIGDGWSHSEIDLAVMLQVTFPSTPPYPFYGPAGMARSDGSVLAPIQPQVSVDGTLRTQISLTTPFNPTVETLGSRFAAVVRWLRDPR